MVNRARVSLGKQKEMEIFSRNIEGVEDIVRDSELGHNSEGVAFDPTPINPTQIKESSDREKEVRKKNEDDFSFHDDCRVLAAFATFNDPRTTISGS